MKKDSKYLAAGELLRVIIRENGTQVLKDCSALETMLLDRKCDTTIVYQLLLMLNSSNVVRYIPQQSTGISMIDINNIIICAEKDTGLSRNTVKALLSALLHGLSIPTDMMSVTIPNTEGYSQKDVALVDFEKYQDDIAVLNEALNEKDEEIITKYADTLELLVKAGHPEALYIKGVCHLYGIATIEDKKMAKKYLYAAYRSGCTRAGAMLGDVSYNNGFLSNTKTFKYYTALGAIALDDERKSRIKALLYQKTCNKKTLIFATILLLISAIFSVLCGSGTFSVNNTVRLGMIITPILLNFGVLITGIVLSIKYKYDNIKWLLPTIVAITMLFAAMAV